MAIGISLLTIRKEGKESMKTVYRVTIYEKGIPSNSYIINGEKTACNCIVEFENAGNYDNGLLVECFDNGQWYETYNYNTGY